jgi:transcription elongation factor GreA
MWDFYMNMQRKKQFVTKQGLEELRQEYNELVSTRRPEIVTQLAEAREQGDLSENAQYQAAREELSFLDDRISELEELLKQVSVIDNSSAKDGMVAVGSRILVNNGKKDEEYMIVGEWEANPKEKKISDMSPLGSALLGKQVGETAIVAAPSGNITYTVKQIL